MIYTLSEIHHHKTDGKAHLRRRTAPLKYESEADLKKPATHTY